MTQTAPPALHPEYDKAFSEALATADRLGGEARAQLEALSQTLKGALEANVLSAATATEKITTLRSERDALKTENDELKTTVRGELDELVKEINALKARLK